MKWKMFFKMLVSKRELRGGKLFNKIFLKALLRYKFFQKISF